MLNFDPQWRFRTPGTLSPPALWAFQTLVDRLVDPAAPQRTLELFKRYFAAAAGEPHSTSSSAPWARSDLERLMGTAADNAPLFIEAFYDACQELERRRPGASPSISIINQVLTEHETGYQLSPPDLVATRSSTPIQVEVSAPSLDDEARTLIQTSLGQAQLLLREGRGRQAVQECLWLLETVFTAFRGLPIAAATVQAKYFNKIAEELKRDSSNPHLQQVLAWITALHGYLSSPTGGGVRHGTDIAATVRLEANDALLYCNLVRSYITFLIESTNGCGQPRGGKLRAPEAVSHSYSGSFGQAVIGLQPNCNPVPLHDCSIGLQHSAEGP